MAFSTTIQKSPWIFLVGAAAAIVVTMGLLDIIDRAVGVVGAVASYFQMKDFDNRLKEQQAQIEAQVRTIDTLLERAKVERVCIVDLGQTIAAVQYVYDRGAVHGNGDGDHFTLDLGQNQKFAYDMQQAWSGCTKMLKDQDSTPAALPK